MSVLLLVLACTCQAPGPSGPAAPPGPDVLWITVDTLRADRLGFAGHDGATTPHLDALAARGAVFPQATTPLPRTTPALASALTGLLPAHHGSVEVGDPIDEVATVAEALQAAGWHTVGISAMSVAGPEQGLDRGFDHFAVHHDLPAPELVREALRATPRDGRRFLWVHMSDPHFPYLPEGDDGGACRVAGQAAASGDLMRVDLFVDRDGKARDMLPGCEALYDGEIARVDRAVGELLAGFGGEPWVFFSADHGEHLGEQGLFYEHGPTVHGANARVPLVIAGPGIRTGARPGLAQLVDLAPTTLGLAEVASPAPVDGVDLGPTLLGGAPVPRQHASMVSGSALQLRLSTSLVAGRGERWCLHDARFSLCHRPRGVSLHDRDRDPELRRDVSDRHPEERARLEAAAAHWGPEQGRERAVLDRTHKLVGRPQLDGGFRWSLYDLDDADEAVDRAADHPEVVARLQAAGAELFEALGAAEALSADEQEQLRALGYLE